MWDISKITLTWSRKRPKNKLRPFSSFENYRNLQSDPKLLNAEPEKWSKFPGNKGESRQILHLQLVLASLYIRDELTIIKVLINGTSTTQTLFEIHAISFLCLEAPEANFCCYTKSLWSWPEMRLGSTSKELIQAHPGVAITHTSSPKQVSQGSCQVQ